MFDKSSSSTSVHWFVCSMDFCVDFQRNLHLSAVNPGKSFDK